MTACLKSFSHFSCLMSIRSSIQTHKSEHAHAEAKVCGYTGTHRRTYMHVQVDVQEKGDIHAPWEKSLRCAPLSKRDGRDPI